MLTVTDIRKAFWGIQALDGVSLTVRRGEIHAVMGENGAGKSTLMRILAGVERADSGEIVFEGRGVSMIHQELLPFPDLTVAENVWMGQELVRGPFGLLDKPAMLRGARERLARAGVWLDPARRMRDLSVAEAQTVEIAKALARDADLFILDEPTSALSAREAESLFALIADLKRRGAGVLYISHHLEEVFRLADTITVLRDGRLVATEPAASLDAARLIALMVGRELDRSAPRAAPTPGEVALEVRGLARAGRFGDVSFTLRRGEVLGVAGLMGAGRTDLASAIYGLAPADTGEIYVRGQRARIASPVDAMRFGVGMVTEDRKQFGVFPNLSVKHNLTVAGLARCCAGPLIRHSAESATAADQIRRFRIRAAGPDAPARNLSGGNQQKVVLAKALLADPDILILDEPTRGIDVGAKAEIYELIAALARDGKAVLLISSEMNEILQLSSRILVMREGQAAGEVRPDRTSPEEILRMAMPVS
jgi:inositol transport system ATP-binding protein